MFMIWVILLMLTFPIIIGGVTYLGGLVSTAVAKFLGLRE